MAIPSDNFGENRDSVWYLSILAAKFDSNNFAFWAIGLSLLGAPTDNMIVESFERLVLLTARVTLSNDSHYLEERTVRHGLMSFTNNILNTTEFDSPCIRWTAMVYPQHHPFRLCQRTKSIKVYKHRNKGAA